MPRTVVFLGHAGLGHGDDVLGAKVLGTFLRKSTALRGFSALLLVNAGVKLTTADSPVRVELSQLIEAGVDVIACGTCVEHYGLTDAVAVGAVKGMDDVIQELDRADKVITL